MKGDLIKRGEGDYKLFINDTPFGQSKQSPYNKLSLNNCQAIENGYDLDELITEELNKLPYTKHLDDGQYNDGQLAGFELGAYWAFQKALEILGDKKFSEGDLDKAFELGKHVEREDCTKNYLTYKQSIKQTEWEVEIVTEKIPCDHNNGWEEIPVLDKDGCLILKKL